MAKSRGAKRVTNMVYGLGASVVILGALFKIMHWPGGNEMLIAGLIVEALVFAYSAFEPIDDDLDWSLVYPELAGGTGARGGSWKDVAYFLQVSSRDYEYMDSARSYIGFRTVQDYLGTDVTLNQSSK